MYKAKRVTGIAAAIGIAALSLASPAHGGNGSAVGVGLVGFGVGAILGSTFASSEAYFISPPPPNYYGPEIYGRPHYYGPVVYGPSDYDGPVVHGPPPRTPHRCSNHAYPRSKTPTHAAADGTRSAASATRKMGTLAGTDQTAEAKFKAAQAKAAKVGVEKLTKEDINGLNNAQLKQLRGY
jgi:hypothetical protein